MLGKLVKLQLRSVPFLRDWCGVRGIALTTPMYQKIALIEKCRSTDKDHH